MRRFSEKVILAGHRGERTVVPENTLAAFRYALSCGVDAIETDFHLSKDGVLMVIHDHTLERTTDGHGRVCDHTFAQLRSLSAGSRFSDAFAEERIPTADPFSQNSFKKNFEKEIRVNAKGAKQSKAARWAGRRGEGRFMRIGTVCRARVPN